MGRAAGAGGMGVVGVLVVLAVGYFFGIDISPIVGASTMAASRPSRAN